MKILKYITILTLAVMFIGCEDYFGEDANVDPDNPITATVNVLLPQVQGRLVYTYGGDFTRYLGINTQHVDGAGRQFVVIGNYGIVPSDCDQMWSNLYSGTMNSNKVMMGTAAESGSAHYEGVGMILESFAIMIATDAWGDIPYSDAINFNENGGVYAPTLDSQESIYNAIFANLAAARGKLSGDDGGNPVGSDDLIYGGDASKWIKFANALEARARIHLSKRDNGVYSQVISLLGDAYADASDEAGFAFGSGATENAPWYQYIEQRDDCEVGATYVGLLESLGDPRLATYGFEHALPHPVFTADQVVKLLSYAEQEFMLAEAYMATNDKASAWTSLQSGINASFAEAGVDGDAATYLADNGVTETNFNMETIMTQKYLALYTSPETFNDWRRTGIPELTPNVGSEIPRRLPYSEAEQFANPDNIPSPGEITIYDRVWWDAQ